MEQFILVGYDYFSAGTATRWIVRRSAGPGEPFETVDSYTPSVSSTNNIAYSVAVSPTDGAVYVGGAETITGNVYGLLRRSSSGLSGTFSNVFTLSGTGLFGGTIYGVGISPVDGAVYTAGHERSVTNGIAFSIWRSLTGLSGTFTVADAVLSGSHATTNVQAFAYDVAVSPVNGAVYVCGQEYSGSNNLSNGVLRRSPTGLSGTFVSADTTSRKLDYFSFNCCSDARTSYFSN